MLAAARERRARDKMVRVSWSISAGISPLGEEDDDGGWS